MDYNHRRRIYMYRSKGKGRLVCLGGRIYSIPCRAIAILPWSIWKNRMNSNYFSKSTEANWHLTFTWLWWVYESCLIVWVERSSLCFVFNQLLCPPPPDRQVWLLPGGLYAGIPALYNSLIHTVGSAHCLSWSWHPHPCEYTYSTGRQTHRHTRQTNRLTITYRQQKDRQFNKQLKDKQIQTISKQTDILVHTLLTPQTARYRHLSTNRHADRLYSHPIDR